jgi:hypothetical protein
MENAISRQELWAFRPPLLHSAEITHWRRDVEILLIQSGTISSLCFDIFFIYFARILILTREQKNIPSSLNVSG